MFQIFGMPHFSYLIMKSHHVKNVSFTSFLGHFILPPVCTLWSRGSGCTISRLSRIDCAKQFFEIRPETRFFSRFRFWSIYSPMSRVSASAFFGHKVRRPPQASLIFCRQFNMAYIHSISKN